MSGARSTNGRGVHMLPNGLQGLDLEGFGSGGRGEVKYLELLKNEEIVEL